MAGARNENSLRRLIVGSGGVFFWGMGRVSETATRGTGERVDGVDAVDLVDGEWMSKTGRCSGPAGAAAFARPTARQVSPQRGVVFSLAVGRRGLNVAGLPALGFERGTFSVLNLWPIQCWWVRSGGMKGKARSSTI